MTNERQNEQYGENQIQVLEGLEAVRKRPAMPFGEIVDSCSPQVGL